MIIDTLKEAAPPFTGTEVHTLTNGARIILHPDHSIPAVAIQAWSKCGGVNEKPEVLGISHGLEHMVFKGTPTRKASEISKTIEGQGGNINAATGLETTHYYLEVPPSGAETALDVLIDTVLHPTFPEDELVRERKVILEEIHRRDDSPEATLWDEFMPAMFQGTPYETKVIGTEKTVSSLQQSDLFSYHKEFYVPSNMVFVVTGDFNRDIALRKLKNALEPLEKKSAPEAARVDVTGWTPQKKEILKPVQLAYVAAGIPVGGLGDKDLVALDLLADVLGGGNSSRFYHQMREEAQTVVSISCDYIAFHQKGIFAFFLDALPKTRKKALEQLFGLIRDLKKNPISEEEVNRAKARLKSDWMFSTETPRGQANSLGSFGTAGHLDVISKYIPTLETLKAGDLMALAEKEIMDKRFTVLSLLPER